jgi:hypothetical protein
MKTEQELLDSSEQWVEGLDHPLPEHLNLSTNCGLPPGLGELKIRLGIQRWPDSHEQHFSARLADSLVWPENWILLNLRCWPGWSGGRACR